MHGTVTTDKLRQALVQKVVSVLRRNERIVVIGWRDSNHNRETRLLAKTGLIEYVLDAPKQFGSNTGLVLCTKFVSHSKFDQLRSGSVVHPIVLSNGTIKRLLFECRDELHQAEARIIAEKSKVIMQDLTLPVVVPLVITKPCNKPEPITSQGVSMETTTPEEQQTAVKDYGKFVQLFLEQASISGGLVGKETLGKIRRSCGFDKVTNTDLVKKGYLVAVVSDGCKNAGRYRAGALISGQSTVEIKPLESNDPLSRARKLVETEVTVNAEIKTLEARLHELDKELTKIGQAKKLISDLESMFKED